MGGITWVQQMTQYQQQQMARFAEQPQQLLGQQPSHPELAAAFAAPPRLVPPSFHRQLRPLGAVRGAPPAAAADAATATAAAEAQAAAAAAQAEAEAQAEERQAQASAAARLRRAVERNEGYFQPQQPLGYVLHSSEFKYTIVDRSPLGVGVFSVVWPCADSRNKLIALKVIRWQDHFRQYADKEVLILQRVKELADRDPEGSAQVAMIRDHFAHKVGDVEHLCLAFEKLESNLRAGGKQPLEKVLKFGKQLLVALRYLHEVVGLVHCDVKPDNLLLRWDGLSVKLCDFGTARAGGAELQAVDELQPLFYRAPEVFLGATRGRKIDLWSAGCTIYELAVGRILFRSCNTHREVVEKMMQLCGPIPIAVREQGRLTRSYFSSQGFHPEVGQPVDPEKTYKKTCMMSELLPHVDFGKARAQAAHDLAKAQLSKLIGKITVIAAATRKKGAAGAELTESEKRVRQLADLVERCLDVDPASRITAAEACEHEAMKAVELPPAAELQEAPPLPAEAPPPLPPMPPAAPEPAGEGPGGT